MSNEPERPVIILPIMCSTLKRVDYFIKEIIYAEGALIGVLDLLYLYTIKSDFILWLFQWENIFIYNFGEFFSVPATTAQFESWPVITAMDWLLIICTIIFVGWLSIYFCVRCIKPLEKIIDLIFAPIIFIGDLIAKTILYLYHRVPRIECIKDLPLEKDGQGEEEPEGGNVFERMVN